MGTFLDMLTLKGRGIDENWGMVGKMEGKPKESDWKAFRKMVPESRERYLTAKNKEIVAIFMDEGRTPTRRFWDVRERIEKERKILEACLDGHSRSKIRWYMHLMYRYGMLNDSDLERFSEDLRNDIKRFGQDFSNHD